MSLFIAGKKFLVDFENSNSRNIESLKIKFSRKRDKLSSSQRFVIIKYLKDEGFFK